MYSFEPSDEQKMLIDAVRRYASGDLRPAAHEAEESSNLPPNLVEKGWELGFLQASIPEDFGGFGEYSAVTGVLAAEEMAWGDLAGMLAVFAPGAFALPILLAGSEEQKKTYLPEVVEAEWKPYTAALLEMRYDFDPNDLSTTAKESGEDYILNGEKAYVPFAQNAKAMIVYANLDGKTQGFIVPGDAQGLEVGERQKLMGINAFPVYKITLNNVQVPKGNRLGGAAGHDFAPILDASRVATAAMAVGLSRAAFEYSRDYAKEREVFGVKVAQKQAIAFMLAEMATEIEAIRLMAWEAAWMLDNNKPEASKSAYLALTGASDMAMMVTDRAVQILGGHGYIREHPVELWMRNGRGIATLTGLAIV
ncbi:MAG TPA: acyl-CoA dehydrogenase family protein [Terriglobales bacterium]|jgi:alkylation response protein AidB-like acyl-CoA dehydrogenase|nr:acyl-CoA dehydrogenase family protein [Terriglobales bacterium]